MADWRQDFIYPYAELYPHTPTANHVSFITDKPIRFRIVVLALMLSILQVKYVFAARSCSSM